MKNRDTPQLRTLGDRARTLYSVLASPGSERAYFFGAWERFALTLFFMVLSAIVMTTSLGFADAHGDAGAEFRMVWQTLTYLLWAMFILALWARPFTYGFVGLGRRAYQWVKA